MSQGMGHLTPAPGGEKLCRGTEKGTLTNLLDWGTRSESAEQSEGPNDRLGVAGILETGESHA